MNDTKVIINPQEGIIIGVNTVADVVETTLGAKGLSVGISKLDPRGAIYDRVIVVDGVTVAKAINLKDEAQNFSAQILIEAAKKQVDAVGDGTSVTISLARAILKQAAPLVAAGEHPQTIKAGLENGVTKLLEALKKQAKPIKTEEDLVRIATISTKDEMLGKLIGEIVYKIGLDGVITAEASKEQDTRIDHQTGLQLDHGWYREWFVTNPERMESVIENPYILVTDKPIVSLIPLTPLLNELVKKSKKIVVISPDISLDALAMFIQNKIENKLLPLCIKAPGFGDNQKAQLADIAVMTGATYVSEDAGYEFENLTIKDLGRADLVSATKDETIIAGGKGKKEEIDKRIASIKATMKEKSGSDFEDLKRKERLGKMTSGVVIVHVGGQTEIEMKERRERVIDGIQAAKAALRDGIVPGGEIVYLSAREALDRSIAAERILYKALERPFICLVENAGYNGGQMLERIIRPTGKYIFNKESGITPQDVAMIDLHDPEQMIIVNGKPEDQVKFIPEKKKNAGIDVQTGEIVDMLKEGILDPAAVPINALMNALSVSCQLLTTKVLIIPDNDKEGD